MSSALKEPNLRFVVTGASGWIGQALLHWLADELGPSFAHRVLPFGSAARTLGEELANRRVMPIETLTGEHCRDALVFHLAYQTMDKIGGMPDSAYARINLALDEMVLAACEAGKPRGVFVASSGAAAEVALGRSKNLYGGLKLVQEQTFAASAARCGYPVFIARIFNVAGPHVNKTDIYALASFLTQGLETGRIAVRADRPVYRSYVHVGDLIRVATADLLAGHSRADGLSISGREIVEMEDVAQAAALQLGLGPHAVSRPKLTDAEPSIYVGEPYAFADLARRHGVRLRTFAEQVADMAAFLSIKHRAAADAGSAPVKKG